MSHATQQTQRQYNRSFSGSVGSGMQSLMGNNDRRYYILEHKVSSKYHRMGESQKIIVDQIEIGRDSRCQVRFDEGFPTVSRRHAAIVKDGENWKILPLSTTNTTFLNGIKLDKEWYLQSGDEIQLSTNGPKLGFIIPSGNNGLVKSIGLTNRMSLFRQQALRPYRKAIWGIASFLLLCCVVGGIVIGKQSALIKDQGEQIASSKELILQQENTIKKLGDENKQQELAIVAAQKQSDSIARVSQNELAALQSKIKNQGSVNVPAVIEPYKDDIYFIVGAIYYNGDILQIPLLNEDGYLVNERGNPVQSPEEAAWMPCMWTGTAFLLDDGRLVTARHCVTPWRFDMYVAQMLVPDRHLEAVITAYSRDGRVIEFSSSDCVMDLSNDRVVGTLDNGYDVIGCTSGRENDWAYYQTYNRSSKLTAATREATANIKAGEQLYVMGYPASLGAESPSQINPIYASASKGRDGLDANGMILISGGVQGGNSGGPVFANINGQMQVVGIVSTMIYGGNYGCATPISRIK